MTWLSTLPKAIILNRAISINKDNSKSQLRFYGLSKFIIYITITCIILIFITGNYLADDSWFNFSSGNIWLALKQVFFILLVISIILILLTVGLRFTRHLKENYDLEVIHKEFTRSMMITHFSALIILINTFLAVTKPF